MIAYLRRVLDRLGAYAANDQPLAAAGNKVALVLAGNGPFYPLYVIALAGSDGMPWLPMTLLAFPVFLMVPAIARRHPLLGRIMLSLAGTAHTVMCTWVLGEKSGTELFLIPCIALAGLLFGVGERIWMLLMAVPPFAAYLLLHGKYGAPPHLYRDDAYAALVSVNAISVGMLSIFFGIVFSGLYAPPAKRSRRA